MRTLFIHCGLHKTGSTTVQRQMGRHADQLAAAGLLVPQSFGSRVGAHHKLANAARRQSKFDGAAEAVDGLVRRLTEWSGPAAILSSEDFETHLANPDSFGRLMSIPERAGLRPVFVIYLRNQQGYFESLYLQLLKHRIAEPASDLLQEVFDTGTLARRKWVFHFDYGRILRFLQGQGVDVIWRNFQELKGGDITQDLMSVVFDGDAPVLTAAGDQQNKADLSSNLFKFVDAARRGGAAGLAFLPQLEGLMEGVYPRLSKEGSAALMDRAAEGNAQLREACGIDLNLPDKPAELVLDRVFSSETLYQINDWHAAGVTELTEAQLNDLRAQWAP